MRGEVENLTVDRSISWVTFSGGSAEWLSAHQTDSTFALFPQIAVLETHLWARKSGSR